MRPLTDDETRVFFEKLSKYIGENIRLLIDRPDGTYCFRLHNGRVFYVKETLMKWAGNIAREDLISFGTSFGKMTKTGKFRLHITALDYIAPYAKASENAEEENDTYVYSNFWVNTQQRRLAYFKMWLKAGAEQQFLYGHHIMKSGLGRITEGTPKYQGIVLYSMNDLPLGFGVAAKSTQECRDCDPMDIIAFHQADIGEYIRSEETIL